MFVCDECGEAFETPYSYREDMNGEGMYDEFFESPCCHASYSDAKHCDCCETNLVADGDNLCNDCKEELFEKIWELKKWSKLAMVDFLNLLDEWEDKNW